MQRIIALLFAVLLLCGCEKAEQPQITEISIPTSAPEEPGGTPPVSACPAEGTPVPEQLNAALAEEMQFCSVVCEDAVNLRAKPSAKAELIAALPAGTKVRVIGFEGRYAQVETAEGDKAGYMIAGYLMPESRVYSGALVQIEENYTYERMMEDIAVLQEEYADLLAVEILGKSAMGRDIPVLRLGNEAAQAHVLVQASIHGREHMTSLLAMALSECWLAAGASEEVCFHVVPMLNPDGVSISQGLVSDEKLKAIYEKDAASGRTEKSFADYLVLWKANGNGVDLNRNFDALWEKVNTAPHISSEGYRGDVPESEPEARALAAYTKRYSFSATVSYHATGSLIYWQFGLNSPVDDRAFALAEQIAAQSGYSVEGDDGTSFGGYKDWASAEMGIPSLTVEIGTRSAPLPEIDFYNIWVRNKNTFKIIENWAKNA